jgi:hypothetical protein
MTEDSDTARKAAEANRGIRTWGDLMRAGFFREPIGGYALWLTVVPAVLFLIWLPPEWQLIAGATLAAGLVTAVILSRRP